jgi:hypothetical protein
VTGTSDLDDILDSNLWGGMERMATGCNRHGRDGADAGSSNPVAVIIPPLARMVEPSTGRLQLATMPVMSVASSVWSMTVH